VIHGRVLTDKRRTEDFFTNITESGENALMMFLGDVGPGS
jgi:hypothetical protein